MNERYVNLGGFQASVLSSDELSKTAFTVSVNADHKELAPQDLSSSYANA